MTKEPRIYNEERIVSLINGIGKTGKPYAKKMKLDPYLTPYTKKSQEQSTQGELRLKF